MKKSYVMKTKYKYAALGTLLIAATLSAPASAENAQPGEFTMGVISDDAYGITVTKGKYEQAIERITKNGKRLPRSFADQINLCVAYTKSYEIEEAGAACDAAIAQVKKQERRVSRINNNRNPEDRAYRANLALALSNRGVLLAATGDAGRAEQDFYAAIALQTRLTSIIEGNLERLDQMSAS